MLVTPDLLITPPMNKDSTESDVEDNKQTTTTEDSSSSSDSSSRYFILYNYNIHMHTPVHVCTLYIRICNPYAHTHIRIHTTPYTQTHTCK